MMPDTDLRALITALLAPWGAVGEVELRLWQRALEPLQVRGCDIEGACAGWMRTRASRPLAVDIVRIASRPALVVDVRDDVWDVALRYGVSADDICAPTRGSDQVVLARQALMAALRHRGLSYPQIGRLIGRDHTTVMHGIRVHQQRQGAGHATH